MGMFVLFIIALIIGAHNSKAIKSFIRNLGAENGANNSSVNMGPDNSDRSGDIHYHQHIYPEITEEPKQLVKITPLRPRQLSTNQPKQLTYRK